MIPTLILVGLIVGRWWLVAIAAIAWPIALAGTKVGSGFTFVFGSAAVAAANTAAGVAVHKSALKIVRRRKQAELRDPQKSFDNFDFDSTRR
jgi:hypothetical protein